MDSGMLRILDAGFGISALWGGFLWTWMVLMSRGEASLRSSNKWDVWGAEDLCFGLKSFYFWPELVPR